MTYYVECNCGKRIPITISQAGSEVMCRCGSLVGVPSFGDLKRGESTPTHMRQPDGSVVEPTAVAPAHSTGDDSSIEAPENTPAAQQSLAYDACPYCGATMEGGRILGDRYALKWLSEHSDLLLGIWAIDGETIGTKGIFTRPQAVGYNCRACRKIVIEY